MDKQKVLAFCENRLEEIVRPCEGVAVFEFDGVSIVREEIGDVEYADSDIEVHVSTGPNKFYTFYWSEEKSTETFIKLLKDEENFTEEEVRFFLQFAYLPSQDAIILKVFEAPIEEFLTHKNPDVREVGKQLETERRGTLHG